MRYVFSVILCCFIGSGFAQTPTLLKPRTQPKRYVDLLQGTWSWVKTDMKDGSQCLNSALLKDMIMVFDSLKRATIINSEGIVPLPYEFSPLDSSLVIATQLFYKVDYVSTDELVFHDHALDRKDYELVRYHLVKKKEPLMTLIKQKFIYPLMRASLSDTIYQMSAFVYPTYQNNRGLIAKTFEDVYGESYYDIEQNFDFKIPKNGRFRVSFLIDEDGKQQDVYINYSTDRTLNLRIEAAIRRTSNAWKPAKIEGEAVKCLVRYEFAYGKAAQNQEVDEVSIQEDFDKGIKKFVDKKYEDALIYFEKVIKADPTHVKAIFNRGAINQLLGKKTEACTDWQYLIQKGQKWVQPYANKYCKD